MRKKEKGIYEKAEKSPLEDVPSLKRKVDKEKIAAYFIEMAKTEPEIERNSFLEEDVRTKERLIDKEKILDIGTKLFGREPETGDGNLCSQKLDGLFTMKVEPKPAQDNRMKMCKGAFEKEIPEKQWAEQARSANREQNIDFIVKFIKSQTSLICIGSKRLYIFNGKVYEDISEQKRAATFFKQILDEKRSRLFRDYSEIHKQLLCDPEIAVDSLEQLPINRDVVVFQNGTFNVREQFFYENQFWEEDYIFSILATDYDRNDLSGKEAVDCFLNTQTSHIKNGICSLKNQYFSSQNSAQAAAELHSNAFCMYFGSL